MAQTGSTATEVLDFVDNEIRKEFDGKRRILSFDEYLAILGENPRRHTRGAAKYIVDMMDHYGKTPVGDDAAISAPEHHRATTYRFKVFDFPVNSHAPKLVGHEEVQTEIYHTLKSFVRQKLNHHLILLHGPNGSAKTTLVRSIMGGLERYSKTDEGPAYTINWVFPIEKLTKGGIGLGDYAASVTTSRQKVTTFAKLPDEEVAARIPCDLKDHPLLVVPKDQRLRVLQKLVGEDVAAEIWREAPSYLTDGDLCHRCKQIYEALLTANGGDYKKVLRHVQVERIFFSRRYRNGLSTVEPQLHVDASYDQLTINKSMASLPASLQSLNLFLLRGDLIDGNRGVVEYSDLLKRPIDTFKYLLGACETGSVNVGSAIAYLDTVLLGTTNELQLDAFKEFPDFSSFKARIELIRVPYLLSVSKEREIYSLLMPQSAGEKHIAPHVDWTLALWAVLTRLKKPNSINYPPNVSSLISNLTPMDKARLYDTGEMPSTISPEERKLVRSNLRKLREEYNNIPYYEGRMGASVREIKGILFDAVHNPEFPCLSPLSVLREMEEFVKKTTDYEFLKQEVKDGYHDAAEFINLVRDEYTDVIDREVRDCIGLYDRAQWEEFIRKYVMHVSLLLKKEKVKNPITGQMENPDQSLVREFEEIVGAPKESGDLEGFRQNVISRIGAWSLEHRNEAMVYSKVFPEYWAKLERHYYESQKALLTKMHNALLVYDTDEADPTTEGAKLARQTVDNMKSRLGYCDQCAKEVITFLMRKRY